MKKILLLTMSVLATFGLFAQPPGGGMGMGPGGGPPPGDMPGRFSQTEEKLILEHFPEIPGLTLEQREKVGAILSKEREDIDKQLKKKREIEKEITSDISEKDLKKKREKIDKIDEKIQELRSKSDEKIKKELSEEQYTVFLEKREDFKFRRHRPQGDWPPRQNSENNSERPPFPPQGPDGDDFF